MTRKQKKLLFRIIITALIFGVLLGLPMNTTLKTLVSLFAYVFIGYDVLKKAAKDGVNGKLFNENFLMAVATIGAIVLALWQQNGDFFEAIAVMLFYQVGELFQSYAVQKSRQNINALMDIRPDYANVERNGSFERIAPDMLIPGSIIFVKPGEKIPLDGVVIDGEASLNTAALTGESIAKYVGVGDNVASGCINLDGILKIKTTKAFEESTACKILQLVEKSSMRKAVSEKFISKFAKKYTPAVCISALALAIVPPILGWIINGAANWQIWIYRALTFLVISCPCALVISIPLTFFAGIGGAGKKGVLIKGANYIETLAKVKTIIFDKTGTLTKGSFEIKAIHHSTIEQTKLLEYAALAEGHSSHPISQSLRVAWGQDIDLSRVGDVKEIGGKGVLSIVDGRQVAAGNERLMEELNITYSPCKSVGTIIHIAIDGEYMGHIVIADTIKPTSKSTIDRLKQLGINRFIMLTGDEIAVAQDVAKEIGIDEIHSNLLPDSKVKRLESILNSAIKGKSVAFVGDGINDAPSLARADVGIAMGGIGSDAALEAADVVIMDDEPLKIAKAIDISKKCVRIVNQNIVLAIGIKFVCLILGAMGITNMWFAIFADVGVMVIAVLNAIRALWN